MTRFGDEMRQFSEELAQKRQARRQAKLNSIAQEVQQMDADIANYYSIAIQTINANSHPQYINVEQQEELNLEVLYQKNASKEAIEQQIEQLKNQLTEF